MDKAILKMKLYSIIGIDTEATGIQIGKLIDESGLSDKHLSEIMNLTVQSINKWRHGRSLPDIGNLFILSRILDKKIDDFIVPLKIEPSVIGVEVEIGKSDDRASKRLKKYAVFLKTFMPVTKAG